MYFFYVILHLGNIRALLVNSKNPSDKTYIFSQTNNQGSGWQQGSADIGQLAAGYKVSFFYQVMHFSKYMLVVVHQLFILDIEKSLGFDTLAVLVASSTFQFFSCNLRQIPQSLLHPTLVSLTLTWLLMMSHSSSVAL